MISEEEAKQYKLTKYLPVYATKWDGSYISREFIGLGGMFVDMMFDKGYIIRHILPGKKYPFRVVFVPIKATMCRIKSYKPSLETKRIVKKAQEMHEFVDTLNNELAKKINHKCKQMCHNLSFDYSVEVTEQIIGELIDEVN